MIRRRSIPDSRAPGPATGWRRRGALAAALLLAACAHVDPELPRRIDALLPADAILIGEQHDAAEHQALQRALAQDLIRRGLLAALLLEMAELGRSTAGLPTDASEDAVRTALAWDAAGWSWARYGPLVMNAVRHGVPVSGANLPRTQVRARMGDAVLDTRLTAVAWARQQQDVHEGHCELLPASQIGPMTRVQVARDQSMAQAIREAAQPGRTVLLVAGGAHVVRGTGVPEHLPPELRTRVVLALAGDAGARRAPFADQVWRTAALPPQDHCAELRQRLQRPAG